MPIAAPVPLTSAVPNSTDLDSASQDESGDTGALAGQDSEGYTPRMRQALRHPKSAGKKPRLVVISSKHLEAITKDYRSSPFEVIFTKHQPLLQDNTDETDEAEGVVPVPQPAVDEGATKRARKPSKKVLESKTQDSEDNTAPSTKVQTDKKGKSKVTRTVVGIQCTA
ncbi:hypothetical protein ABBQ38_000745 [Trebouxia sp. C0009 RCD-2024]